MADLAPGTVDSGYRFKGGDPSEQTNWEPVGLKIGTVDSGYRFKGGDPSEESNWEPQSKGFLDRAGDAVRRVSDTLFNSDKPSTIAEQTPSRDMLREDFIADFRNNVIGKLAPEKRMDALLTYANTNTVQGRAARLILEDVKRENQFYVGKDADLKLADTINAAPRITPKNGTKPPSQIAPNVSIPDTTPTFDDMKAGRTQQEIGARLDMGAKLKTANDQAGFDQRAGTELYRETAEATAKANRRDFREQFAADNPITGAVASGGAQLVNGLVNAVPALADAFNKLAVDPFLTLLGESPMPPAPRSDFMRDAADQYTNGYGKQKLAQAWENDIFPAWLAVKVAQQVPQMTMVGAAIVNPAAALMVLPTLGATAAGNAYAQGDDGRIAIAKGLWEILSEGASLGLAHKTLAFVEGLSTPLKQSLFRNIAQRITQAGAVMTAQSVAGAIEESVAKLGENAIDKFINGKPKTGLLDDVAESGVIGAATQGASGAKATMVAAQDRRPERLVERALSDNLDRGEFRPLEPGDFATLNPNLANVNPEKVADKVMSAPTVDDAIERAKAISSSLVTPRADLLSNQPQDPLLGAMREREASPPTFANTDPADLLERRGDPLQPLVEDRRVRTDTMDFLDRQQQAQREAELDSIQTAASDLNVTTEGKPERERAAAVASELPGQTAMADALQRSGALGVDWTPPQPAQPATLWTGRKGDGYASAADALNALESRQKAAPEYQWKVEQRGERFVLAGYEREIQTPQGFAIERRPDGTIRIKGDAPAITQALTSAGITKFTTGANGGVTVGVSQSESAIQALTQPGTTNDSATSDIPRVASRADRRGLSQPAVGMATGVGTSGVEGSAVDTGSVRPEPTGRAVPPVSTDLAGESSDAVGPGRIEPTNAATELSAAPSASTEIQTSAQPATGDSPVTPRFQTTLNPTGTLTVRGDVDAIKQTLRDGGITSGVSKVKDYVLVGKASAEAARKLLEAPQEPVRTSFKRETGDGPILQNRNRATPSSIVQMRGIAANPDYGRLGFSRDFANGAPVVSGEIEPAHMGKSDVAVAADGRRIPIRYAVVESADVLASNNVDGSPNPNYGQPNALLAIAGNGRIAGLQAAYQDGTASTYRQELQNDDLHGIDPTIISGMKNPVLVRIMPKESVTADIGDVSNTTGNLNLSAVEQANNDVQRVDLDALSFREDGAVTTEAVRQFVRAMPQTEQGALLDTNGQPTRQAVDRLNAAVFARAYGNDRLVRLYAQAQDAEARLILSALAQAAPKLARLEGAGDLDIRPIIADAAQIAINARRDGISIARAAAQQDIDSDPDVAIVLDLFAANPRSSKPIVEALVRAADFAYTESTKPEADMFGSVLRASRSDVMQRISNDTGRSQSLEERSGGLPAGQDVVGSAEGRAGPQDPGDAEANRATREASRPPEAISPEQAPSSDGVSVSEADDALQISFGNFVTRYTDTLISKPQGSWVLTNGNDKSYRDPEFTAFYSLGGGRWGSSEGPYKTAAEALASLKRRYTGDPANLRQLPASEFKPARQQDLLGEAPNESQQAAERIRKESEDRDRQRQQNAPGAEEFGLGMVDQQRGKEVDPRQDDLGGMFASEPNSDYSGAYETDLFGQPLPNVTAGISRSKSRSTGVRRDIQPSTAVPGDAAEGTAGDYFVNTYVSTPTQRALGASVIQTPADLAQATQYLYRSAVERFDAIVTDKNGKPLAVVGNFKGAISQAAVYPAVVMAEAIRVPGGANIWFSHNHPSGNSSLSRDDRNLAENLRRVFDGTGITARGVIAIGSGKYGFYDPAAQNEDSGTIPAVGAAISVPVYEREMADGRQSKIAITSPQVAKDVAKQFYDKAKESGLILLDAQNAVVAWIPLDSTLQGPLRRTGGLDSLYRALSKSNASAAIFVHDGDLDARIPGGPTIVDNIGGALMGADVRPLDAINVLSGVSRAEKGLTLGRAGLFFSRKDAPPFYSALAREIEGVNAKSMPGAMWSDRITGLINTGKVKADEVEWSGIREWLALQEGKVTKEQVAAYLNANGVKVQEVTLGGEPSMDVVRNRYMQAMVRQGVSASEADQIFREMQAFAEDRDHDENMKDRGFELVMRDGENTGNEIHDAGQDNETKFGTYVLPGGENYREVLLTLPHHESVEALRAEANAVRAKLDAAYDDDGSLKPGITQDEIDRLEKELDKAEQAWDAADSGSQQIYRSSHWDQPNVLAHVRLNDRVDADGKRVLFVEEIQSDWGQQGRDKGFAANPRTATFSQYGDGKWQVEADGGKVFQNGFASREAAEAWLRSGAYAGAPRAPFVESTEKWLTLALKRIVVMAAQEGYDRVAFTNGQQNADRYDLSKQISKVEWTQQPTSQTGTNSTPPTDGTIKAWNKDGNGVISERISADKLADYIGKDVAQKLLESPVKSHKGYDEVRSLSGLDLKVGGEGMRSFYDKIVPSTVNKLLGKVGGGKIDTVSIRSAPGAGGAVSGQNVMAALGRDVSEWINMDGTERDRLLQDYRAGKVQLQQPGFDITPAMKEKVSGGLPLFSRPYTSQTEAIKATVGQDAWIVSDENGGWLLAPRARPYNPQERQDAQQHVDTLNRALKRAGMARAQVLRDTPTGAMLIASRAAGVLGMPVTFIESHSGFDGVSLGGHAFVGPSTRHPAVALVGHEVTHSLEKTDPKAYEALAGQIRGYLKEGVVEAKRQWEEANGGKNTTTAKAESEVIADLNGAMWVDPLFWREMAQRDANLFRKVAYKFMEVASKAMQGLSRFKADEMVTDVGAVRTIIAQEWARQARKNGGKSEFTKMDGGDASFSSKQRTIEVDGIRRPITDSNGRLVGRDFQEQQNFWKFFGDSAVVDSEGRPLVVYHGTNADVTTFEVQYGNEGENDTAGLYFTADPDYAAEYTYKTTLGGADHTGGNVMPVYLSMRNPKVVEDENIYASAHLTKDEVAELQAQGYDGIINPSASEYVVFSPTQIKSAIGNSGAFDGNDPDLRFSRTKIVGQTNRQYTPEQTRAMENVGFKTEVPTLAERAKALYADAGKKMAQGIFDQFAPVASLDKDAYALLRLSKGSSGAFETFMRGGKLKLTDNVYDIDETQRGGVVDKLLIPLQGEHHDFLRWVAANRAEQLTAQGRENLFTPQDITDLKTLASGTTTFDYTIQTGPNAGTVTRDRTLIYADAQRVFNGFNRNVLDLAEQSGLIDGQSRQLWEQEFYVPFYRVADDKDGGVRGMNIKGGVVRQQAFKELKGGKEALNSDLLDNTLMNWAHLLDAAAKNRAAKATLEAAERMGVALSAPQYTAGQIATATGNKNGVVWFMDGGQQRFFVVDDPGILSAISAIEYAGMRNPLINAMTLFKHVLTVGVTASPHFKVRNLIRDSVQAIATGPLSYNPAGNLVEGWKATNPESDAYFRLLAGGGTIHFGTMYEGSEAKRVQALVESGVDDATILNDPAKIKMFYRKFVEPAITAYNELGNRGETINRAALYQQLRRQGLNHADASLQARDLMDFSMQGSWTAVRFFTQVVPFLNARLQGLYKLGRGAKGDPARFAAVLGATALLSLGLLAAYSDDDDWKKREEWDRNNYWWFKIGGMAFRIPKPFEIGAIATLAERGAELFFDKEMTGKRFRKQVMELLSDNLSLNPVPQLVKPILDIYANKDSFTGRPIHNLGMEKVRPEYRFNENTSMVARGLSTAANKVTGLVGANGPSPMQIDHLVRGYFGWLGSFVVKAADTIARPVTDQPSRPTPDYWKVASGGMISDVRDGQSRYVSQMYEQSKEIEQAYGTWQRLQKEGKSGEAKEFLADHKEDIVKYRNISAIKRAEASLNERIRIIERSKLSSDEKATKIRALRERKDKIARLVK